MDRYDGDNDDDDDDDDDDTHTHTHTHTHTQCETRHQWMLLLTSGVSIARTIAQCKLS